MKETDMRIRSIHTVLLLLGIGFSPALAQTSVSASVYGAFSGTTTGNGVAQSPSNSAGVMLGVRHISNPLIGYEATYSYNHANQRYTPLVSCGIPCGSDVPASVSAAAHEVAADWIVSVRLANVRPFVLGGGGLVFNEPNGAQTETSSSTKPVFVYGAGLDWGLIPHIGLRLQYRGNLYKAPDLTRLYTSSGAFTHTAEPVIGAYLRF